MHIRDERMRLFLSAGLVVLLGACALVLVMVLPIGESVPAAAHKEISGSAAETLARDYLAGLKQLPANVESVKVERYWVPANHFWAAMSGGKAMPAKPALKDCWVVTFYYNELHPQAWKTVFVAVADGRIVGGSRCGH